MSSYISLSARVNGHLQISVSVEITVTHYIPGNSLTVIKNSFKENQTLHSKD